MRNRVKGYGLSVAGWMAAVALFCLIRFVGIESLPQFQGVDFEKIDFHLMVIRGSMLGLILGTVFYFLDVALDRPSIRRRSYGAIILIQMASNLAMVVVAQSFMAAIEIGQANRGAYWQVLEQRLLSANFLVVLIYISVVSFLFGLLKQVDRKFGPGNLRRLLLGMYHHPREEERIFMFLDMKDSTTHAERMGHVNFSRMIQDCFIDLSAVNDTQAQIYQYVGDEVILFWDVGLGLQNANCLRAYLQFSDQLLSRAEHYQAKYDVVPFFKAGIHIGSAMVLEVGEIKREISYLGDLLNTAARIQGECKRLGAGLLVSEPLMRRLEPLPEDLVSQSIGEVELRGRQNAMHVFRVLRRENANLGNLL